MDASELMRRRKSRAMFIDQRDNGHKQSAYKIRDATAMNYVAVAAMDPLIRDTNPRMAPQIRSSVPAVAPPFSVKVNSIVNIVEETDTATGKFSIANSMYDALDAVLQHVATQGLGPTRGSRMFYLFFAAAAQAYNWVIASGPVSGTKDGWNFDVHHPLVSPADQYCWINHTLAAIMPEFVPSFDVVAFLNNERTIMLWDEAQQTANVARIKTAGHFDQWNLAFSNWLTDRNNDNSVLAAVPPADASLPNRGTALRVYDNMQNPNSWLAPEKWAPLQITPTGNKQKYLTWRWDIVRSTGLSSEDEADIKAAANAEYPPAHNSAVHPNRLDEIEDVRVISTRLTDEQKVFAEFWAGGPTTVAPPGMFVWFWKCFMQVEDIAQTQGYATFFFSGLDLAAHLFEAGRLAWALKYDHMQSRPIQDIRKWYRGRSMVSWDGSTIDGSQWTPYQETDFVSPPFPDFVSGHSTFSQSFANVMTAWFGPTIPETKLLPMKDIRLLSPCLDEAQTQHFGNIVFEAGKSQIQPGVVPTANITLTWSTWQDMADSAGMSRLYGGIHALSAHKGGQSTANALHTYMNRHWGITRN
jgi:hypothetical protein